jgi:hypothetical protein
MAKYKHPVLKFYHEHPIIGFFLIPLFWDLPARVLQAGVRTAKYGEYTLGAATPATMVSRQDAALNMGVGEMPADAAFSFFGQVTNEDTVANRVNTLRSQGAPASGASFPPRGDTYRDTQHLNSSQKGDARVTDPFYKDTSMRRQTASGASIQDNPHAYSERGWLELKPSFPTIYNPKPADKFADPDLVRLMKGGAVFAGIQNLGRLR